jgi:acetyl-CoA carboxylase biotin carboxyl carrier protein
MSAGASGGGPRFDAEAIRALAQILRETDLTEIELVEKDSRIRVVRAPPPAIPRHPTALVAMPPDTPAAPREEPDTAHPGLVTSPMVGVAYLAPEPGAAPFVTLGARVEQGQTLLLIEAMKTYNQVRSPRAGTVSRILIESATPVEYGQPLLVVD